MLKQTAKIICLLGALSLGAWSAMGQTGSSSADLTGTVSDPAKLPLYGAAVTATDVATGMTRNAMSDMNGVYRLPVLRPGVYDVKIEISGFSTQIKRGVVLTVGQSLTLNFEMEIGAIEKAVVVETDEPLIEADRAHQSATITQRPINELPIDGRNFLDFAKLTPGV
ncbi:MAG: carboxypeptidase regulatory-like domain-containing protein, partial [Chloracidobacterium sp.]|nr:carboxypeptidase regulatory-like domain-containing protein [Chloracidobacterium sp.]